MSVLVCLKLWQGLVGINFGVLGVGVCKLKSTHCLLHMKGGVEGAIVDVNCGLLKVEARPCSYQLRCPGRGGGQVEVQFCILHMGGGEREPVLMSF